MDPADVVQLAAFHHLPPRTVGAQPLQQNRPRDVALLLEQLARGMVPVDAASRRAFARRRSPPRPDHGPPDLSRSGLLTLPRARRCM